MERWDGEEASDREEVALCGLWIGQEPAQSRRRRTTPKHLFSKTSYDVRMSRRGRGRR